MISKEEYAALREQIIAELKRKGYAIKTTMRTAKNRYNKPTSFAVYTLAEV